MKMNKIAAGLTLAAFSTAALAGGPLIVHKELMTPYKWDTSKGSIPVWTDGGPLIADKDGNLVQSFSVIEQGTRFGWSGLTQDVHTADGQIIPKGTKYADKDYIFLTIDQANGLTAEAVAEWTNVETSTFAMDVRGTIESQTGIANVDETNVGEIYGVENGYGFWVNYDTDGAILEDYFGVPRNNVLGIAFPEWADEETGEITEATALMNGWFVDINDNDGQMLKGVFTHEFGHAINMSHSQANGPMAYLADRNRPMYDGVLGCDGVNTYIRSSTSGSVMPNDAIETMFPFINVRGDGGRQQGTVDITDDKVNISDLYPTDEYKTQYGSISGKLFTKEGVEYSGINMVARNINDPLYDVITQQSGNMTQGMVGPDGSFTINGLTPGEEYVLYIESIKAGGYPTNPTPIVSEPEYWNEGESSNPAEDNACALSTITVAGGETKQLEMHFNGYTDGIQYTPLVNAYVVDHSKNGKRAMGTTSSGFPFMYDSVKNDFVIMVDEEGQPLLATTNPAMNKTATKAAVLADFNGNDIDQGAIWDLRSGKISPLEDPSSNTCSLSSSSGRSSHSIWDIDDTGDTVVGTFRISTETLAEGGAWECSEEKPYLSIAVPATWNSITGKATPLFDKLEYKPRAWGNGWNPVIMNEDGTDGRAVAWIRADRVSGNGKTITGMTNGSGQVAWVDGELHDLYTMFGAYNGSVISGDGQMVSFGSAAGGMLLWNTENDDVTEMGGLEYCTDIPFSDWRFGNLCARFGRDWVWNNIARYALVVPLDASEDLSVITTRSGSLFTGFTGAIYIEGLGWMSTGEFFGRQGVVEAKYLLTNNIFGVSASGSEMMGGLAGAQLSIEIDASKAFVCDNGRNVELSFPKQVVQAVKKGAEFGRCEHLNDSY